MASQIISLMSVNSTVYSDVDQRKHQSSASLAFVRGIHRWPVNPPNKGPVTRKIFPFDDVIVWSYCSIAISHWYIPWNMNRLLRCLVSLCLCYKRLDSFAMENRYYRLLSTMVNRHAKLLHHDKQLFYKMMGISRQNYCLNRANNFHY